MQFSFGTLKYMVITAKGVNLPCENLRCLIEHIEKKGSSCLNTRIFAVTVVLENRLEAAVLLHNVDMERHVSCACS